MEYVEKENVILTKTYDFAIRIVRLYQYLCKEKKEYELSKQILRSGTSIGSNVEESVGRTIAKRFSRQIRRFVQRNARNPLLASTVARHRLYFSRTSSKYAQRCR